MSETLLATKLYIPTIRPNLIPRIELIKRLNSNLFLEDQREKREQFSRKLTLFSAPAGFGKTSLMSEWVHSCKLPFAWVSLDEGDSDLTRFLNYFTAALKSIQPGVGEGTLSMLRSSPPPPIEVILSGLINEILEMDEAILMVFDDYHRVQSSEIDEALKFFIERQPPQFHLVIGTRRDPLLPLARLRARGDIVEMRAKDIRFTIIETRSFINQETGYQLNEDDLSILDTRLEGWIAGLQLAALSMQGLAHNASTTDFISSFAVDDRHIFDFLMDEVLAQRPEGTRDFLLQTSILEHMTGPLCSAVTRKQGGQLILENLETANLFITPLDNRREWFRYHHLFADLLKHRLKQIDPAMIPRLHQRACDWYAEQGFPEEAFQHALQAGDFDRAAILMENNVFTFLKRGETKTIRRLLDSLPSNTVKNKPGLGIAYAWSLFSNFRLDEIEPYLIDIELALQESPDPAFAGHPQAIRAAIAAIEGEPRQALDRYHQALDSVSEASTNLRGIILVGLGTAYMKCDMLEEANSTLHEAVELTLTDENILVALTALQTLAKIELSRGELNKAEKTYHRAIQLSTIKNTARSTILPAAGIAYGGLAELQFERNDLESSFQNARFGIELGHRGGLADSILLGHKILVGIYQTKGDYKQAHRIVKEAKEIINQMKVPRWIPGIAALEARLFMRQYQTDLESSHLHAAIQWLLASPLSTDWHLESRITPLPGFSRDFEHLTMARLLMLQGELDEALKLLEWLIAAAHYAGRRKSIIEISILQAIICDQLNEKEEASRKFRTALELAEFQGITRVFFDEGAEAARLLYQELERGYVSNFADQLLSVFSDESNVIEDASKKYANNIFIEPLSARELDVLLLIAEGLSNPEIASKLYLSRNTIKSHTHSIFGKLGVKNRLQAVTKARTFGILPPN